MRGIIEDGHVRTALDRAMDEWDGCRIAWEAVTWAIVRDPEYAGTLLPDQTKLYVLEYVGAMSNSQPTIKVLYSFDEQNVTIHDAKFDRPIATFAGSA